MSQYPSAERHPFVSMLLLLMLALAGAIVFTIIGLAIGGALYGMKPMLEGLAGTQTNLNLLKLIQIFSSTGMFIFPVLLFARMQSKRWMDYLKLDRFSMFLLLLTILIMFSSMPILEWSTELNKSMKLPGFLKGLEDWMFNQEKQLAELTKQLLSMNSITDLLVNLLMLAVIPAIGEELFFRGGLQQLFNKWFRNHHVAIWLTAIIFSAIHLQFYGFLPRMLLGALFGYLFVWSKSLWLPILAHFINNASAVIIAYIYQRKGIPLDKLDQAEPIKWYIYLISFVSVSALLWFFYKQSLRQKVQTAELPDGD
ncbi:MAG: CPBP family intramembrane glutamic endopeptidase [Daejeonella sp.]